MSGAFQPSRASASSVLECAGNGRATIQAPATGHRSPMACACSPLPSAPWWVASTGFPDLGDLLHVPVVTAGLVQMRAEHGLGGNRTEHDHLLVGSGFPGLSPLWSGGGFHTRAPTTQPAAVGLVTGDQALRGVVTARMLMRAQPPLPCPGQPTAHHCRWRSSWADTSLLLTKPSVTLCC